jgi:uncharacterized protein YndB with AHSA1/START domain
MKKVLIGLGVGAVAIAAGLVVFVSMQPDTMHIERSKTIAAQPGDLWPYVSDLKGFVKWDPWSEIDPNVKMEFSDPPGGVGAWYSWKGNDDVGSGKMTITAAEENVKVVEDLAFVEPFESTAVVTLTMTPAEGGTQVTWGFDSDQNFMSKAFGLVMDMDAMLGADFEKGLGKLATVAEASAKERVAAEEKAAAEAAAAAATAEGAAPAAADAAKAP